MMLESERGLLLYEFIVHSNPMNPRLTVFLVATEENECAGKQILPQKDVINHIRCNRKEISHLYLFEYIWLHKMIPDKFMDESKSSTLAIGKRSFWTGFSDHHQRLENDGDCWA